MAYRWSKMGRDAGRDLSEKVEEHHRSENLREGVCNALQNGFVIRQGRLQKCLMGARRVRNPFRPSCNAFTNSVLMRPPSSRTRGRILLTPDHDELDGQYVGRGVFCTSTHDNRHGIGIRYQGGSPEVDAQAVEATHRSRVGNAMLVSCAEPSQTSTDSQKLERSLRF